MPDLSDFKKELKIRANPQRAKISQRYFKTGKGEYGEGDVFCGLSVPERRELAQKYKELKLAEVLKLLRSKIHEERNIALLILVDKFYRGAAADKQKQIFNLYLSNTKYINNWDLIDLSAGKIAGEYLFSKPKTILFKLAKSKNFWERRIAIMATYNFIKKNEFKETLKIAKMLLDDKEDLIHKAVGWMLREVGNRNLTVEENFLKKYYQKMPRTMLRYAIEKFTDKKRKKYLARF